MTPDECRSIFRTVMRRSIKGVSISSDQIFITHHATPAAGTDQYWFFVTHQRPSSAGLEAIKTGLDFVGQFASAAAPMPSPGMGAASTGLTVAGAGASGIGGGVPSGLAMFQRSLKPATSGTVNEFQFNQVFLEMKKQVGTLTYVAMEGDGHRARICQTDDQKQYWVWTSKKVVLETAHSFPLGTASGGPVVMVNGKNVPY